MAYTILRHTSPEMMQTINGRVVVLDYYVPFVHLKKNRRNYVAYPSLLCNIQSTTCTPLGAFLIISTNFARGVMVFMKIFLEQDVTYLPYEHAFSYVYVTSQN